tara:strand:- start:4008 stop:4172 length:165 start_codon:yes stop_codon:yes gene_type:complete
MWYFIDKCLRAREKEKKLKKREDELLYLVNDLLKTQNEILKYIDHKNKKMVGVE